MDSKPANKQDSKQVSQQESRLQGVNFISDTNSGLPPMSLLISFNSSAPEHRLAVLQPSRARQKERTLPSHQEDSEQGMFRSFSPHLGRMKQRSISGIKQPTLAPQKVSFFEKITSFQTSELRKIERLMLKNLTFLKLLRFWTTKCVIRPLKLKTVACILRGF